MVLISSVFVFILLAKVYNHERMIACCINGAMFWSFNHISVYIVNSLGSTKYMTFNRKICACYIAVLLHSILCSLRKKNDCKNKKIYKYSTLSGKILSFVFCFISHFICLHEFLLISFILHSFFEQVQIICLQFYSIFPVNILRPFLCIYNNHQNYWQTVLCLWFRKRNHFNMKFVTTL